MKLLWQLFFSYRLRLGGVFIGVALSAISATFLPFTLKLLIDNAIQRGGENLISIAFFYMSILSISAISGRSVDFLLIKLIPKMRSSLILNVWRYLTLHSYGYFLQNSSGALGNKISDMARSLEAFIQTGIGVIFYQIVVLITVSALMSSIHSIFACIMLIWVILFVAVSLLSSIKTIHQSRDYSESYSKLIGQIIDRLTNMATIQLFSGYKREQELLTRHLDSVSSEDISLGSRVKNTKTIQDLFVVILFLFLLSTLIVLYRKQLLSPGDFAFILTSATTILQGLWNLMGRGLVEFSKNIGLYKQAFTTIYASYGLKDHLNAPSLIAHKGKIEFRSVVFKYETSLILNDFNFVIRAKEKVGVVGLSGVGKTTLVHLMTRNFDPNQGEILIDGQNIQFVTLESLRAQISIVSQDTALFNRTLFENILYGKVDASHDEVVEASKKAHCHDFISQLKEGYNTVVGEKGIKLSVGQRQRILIARAILKNAPIVLLDEPTSSLDVQTESRVLDSLNLLLAEKTTVMISHRLSSLQKMDRVVVVDKGRIVEEGFHPDLVQRFPESIFTN